MKNSQGLKIIKIIKENLVNNGLSRFGWPQGKTERKPKERQVSGSCPRTEKNMEHKSDGDTSYNWCTWFSHQMMNKRTGGLGVKRTNEDHSNNSIIEIGQNTKKSPGNLRKLAVTQTRVENHQLTLVWKTLKRVI